MGVASKTGSAVKRAAKWWVQGWTKPVATLVPAESRARFGAHKLLYRFFRDSVSRGAKAWRKREAIRMTYEEMLHSWGIQLHEVPSVMRQLRQGRWLAIVLALVALASTTWQLTQLQWHGIMTFMLMLMIAINGAIMSWKLSCLSQRRYEEFFEWMGFPRQTNP